MQLGMIGLGRMGASMVRRLLNKGHGCVVYDRHPPAVASLQAAWVVVDPVLPYPGGTWGPAEADALIACDGGWRNPAPEKACG